MTKENKQKMCSYCGAIDRTVNRYLFDGLCSECTDKSLNDDGSISKYASAKNEQIQREMVV
tara:strand:+ start:18896 stop:19078 length:183 start_codon:yes stop_codon:yes gene_type:complete